MARAFLRTAPALLLMLGTMLFSIAGCGNGSDPQAVVASFDGSPITLGYMEAKWAKLAESDGKFIPTPESIDSLRTAVLDVILKKEIIVAQAFKEKFVEDEVYQKAKKSQRDQKLIELLRDKNINSRVPEFSEEEVKDHYKYVGLSVEARHVDVDLEKQAKELVAKIRSGEMGFHEAALAYSTNPDRVSGGAMGNIGFGNNIKSVEDVLFNSEEGVVTDPIKTPYGWSFFIVDKINHSEPGEYGAVRASIVNRLKMRAMRELGAEHTKRVMDKYGFSFNWETAQVVLDKMPDDLTPSQMQDARSTTTEKPILKFSQEELRLPLYELEGKPYTLAEFSDEYDRLHPYARPQKGNRLQGIFNWANREVVNILMPREAQVDGLDREPLFMLAMKEFEEQACIGVVRRVLVDQPIVLSDTEVREWYDANPLFYTLKPQVRVYQMANTDEEQIQKAYERLLAGEDFHYVAREHSVVPEHQMLTQPFHPDSVADPGNLAIASIQRLENVGDFTPPFENQGYWGIAQLNEKIDGRLMDFEEAYEKATKDLREITSNARLDSLLGLWRQDHDIVIHDKVLKHAKMGELKFLDS